MIAEFWINQKHLCRGLFIFTKLLFKLQKCIN